MSHKRKQARKIKKAMKKQVQKAKQKHEKQEKQLPNQEMLLKLMAMMKGGPGGQPMDAATFLKLKEEAAAKQKEDNRLIREAKSVEQNAKADEKNAQSEFKVKQAQGKAATAKKKRDDTIEMLGFRVQAEGLTQEERAKVEQISKLAHEKELNQIKGNMDATTIRIEKLNRAIKNLEGSIDLKQTSDEVRSLVTTLQERQDMVEKTWGELYEALKNNALTKEERDKLSSLVDDIASQNKELIAAKQKIDFEKKQYLEEIETKNQRVEDFHKLEKDVRDGNIELQLLKEKARTAAYIYDRDEDGNIIETYDKSEEVIPIVPDEDETYKKYHNELYKVLRHLDQFVAPKGSKVNDETWLNLHKMMDENTDQYNEYANIYKTSDPVSLAIYRDKGGKYKRDDKGRYMYVDGGYEGAQEKLKKAEFTSRYKKPDGEYLIEFEDVVKYIKDLNDKVKKAHSEAQQKYNEAKEHNAKIQALPEPFEVTWDKINKKYVELDKIKHKLEQQHHDIKTKEELKKLYNDLVNEINLEKARLDPSHTYVISDGLIQQVASAERERDILKRARDVKERDEKKIYELQDNVYNTVFDNKVEKRRLEDSPTSKKTREQLQEEAIQAQVEAEKQRELNEARRMTYKSEQEKRMLEMKENAAQSDKVKELDDKITREKAKGRVAEVQKEQYEELDRVRKDTRNKMVAVDIQKKVNEHLRTHSGSAIQDATTQLVVMGNEIDRQVAAEEKLKNEAKPLIERFERYPEQFEIFNKVIRKPDFNGFDTTGQLFDAVQTQQNLQGIKDFFDQFDRGEIVIPNDGGSSDDDFLG